MQHVDLYINDWGQAETTLLGKVSTRHAKFLSGVVRDGYAFDVRLSDPHTEADCKFRDSVTLPFQSIPVG